MKLPSPDKQILIYLTELTAKVARGEVIIEEVREDRPVTAFNVLGSAPPVLMPEAHYTIKLTVVNT